MSQINEKLNKQLKIEKNAFELYNSFIKKIDDFKLRNEVIKIRNDEKEHINLVKEMISIMRGYKAGIRTTKTKEKAINLGGFIDKFNSLLVMTDIGGYAHAITRVIEELGVDCIYLSFNKTPRYIKKLLAEYKIDLRRIKFVNCVKFSKEGDINANPEALTEISLALEEMMQKMKGKFFILVDTISAFSLYHSANSILRFVGLVNSKLEKYNGGIIWMAVDDENEEGLNEKIGPLCDKIIRYGS